MSDSEHSSQPATQPRFDPEAEHQQKPRLRPIRGFPAQVQGQDGPQQALGLADARQISQKLVFTQPAMQVVLPLFNGENGLDQIVEQVGRGLTRPVLEAFVAQLDDAGLLEGPSFDAMWEGMKSEFDSSSILPPGQTIAFAEQAVLQEAANAAGRAYLEENPEDQAGAQQAAQEAAQAVTDEQKAEQAPQKLAQVFDQWMGKAVEEADDPSFDQLPKAIAVPHLPYQQGFVNYAAVYARMRVVDRPRLIVILGTNNFGQSTGVCTCDKGFATPFGESPADGEMIGLVRDKLGDAPFEHRYDHEREHSIELQIAWLQHVLGTPGEPRVPVFAALVHDPIIANGASYDGKGVSLDDFVAAMVEAVDTLEGPTLVVASHELSHVGQAFGDQNPLAGNDPQAEQARNQVVQTDRQLLQMLIDGKPQDLVSSLAWQQNPTRWSSTGVLVAAHLIARPEAARLINYAASMDQQGAAMVTSSAMAFF